MKKILILIFCLIIKVSHAQVIVESNVSESYYKAFKKLSLEHQNIIINNPVKHNLVNVGGYAIFTAYTIDTLNKKDKTDHTNIHILSIDTNLVNGKETLHADNFNEKITYMPIPYDVKLKGRTLILKPDGPFPPYLIHTISGKNIVTTYEEYYKRDTVLRMSLENSKTQQLSIPVKTIYFKINTSAYLPGNIVFGEVEFITKPYYLDDVGFKKGFIKKQLHCKYVFKAVIKKTYK